MNNDKTTRKLNNIVKNLNKIQEKTSNILLTPQDIKEPQQKMLGKRKIKKLKLKAKYFKSVKEELTNEEMTIKFFDRITEKSENKKCRLSYILEARSDKSRI